MGRMLAGAVSVAVQGIEAVIVEVEVDIVKGLPGFTIVGLPDSTIKRRASASARPSKTPGSSFRRRTSW